MSLKSLLLPPLIERMLGADRLRAKRRSAERRRLAKGEPHRLRYFHQADDPYSQLLVQALAVLAERYELRVQAHLVSAPVDSAAPDRRRLIDYSRTDGARLAKRAGLAFTDPGTQPAASLCRAAEARLADCLADEERFLKEAAAIGAALWRGDAAGIAPGASDEAVREAKARGDALRRRHGHYLGATIHYGGEWYWGLDRLHYLESRLAELGARRSGAPEGPVFAPPLTLGDVPVAGDTAPPHSPVPELHYYLSFRSPYTYIATERVKALADACGARLRLRFVLPMVMRNLPVPRAKGMYIIHDVAREARRLGIPYGRIADPVGKPTTRGYALVPWAREQGLAYEFCLSFMRGVWAEGIDAGSDKGMRVIVERVGLDWTQAREMLRNEDWRDEEEANQQDLLERGIWGVPSFRVGDTAVWGQDRLWVVEEALKTQCQAGPASAAAPESTAPASGDAA